MLHLPDDLRRLDPTEPGHLDIHDDEGDRGGPGLKQVDGL